MLNIRTMKGDELPPFLAQGMVGLTNPNSKHHGWIRQIANEKKPDDIPEDLLYAVAEQDDSFDIQPIGWASIYIWQGVKALEGFVHPDWRNRKIASACAAVLINSLPEKPDEVAVFSSECQRVALWLNIPSIVRFTRVDDGWLKINVK